MTRHRTGGDRIRRGRGIPISEDRGTIAVLLLVILVGVALGALLVPMIITQDRTSRFDSTRVQALDAAQAGIDVMLSNIRLVTTGDSSKLPCPVAPITGPANLAATVAAPGGAAVYSVSVAYYTSDPLQILPPATTLPPAMTCSAGFLTGTAIPSYAQVSSTGTVPPVANGSTNGRTLKSTYQFQTDNTTGGMIQISPNGIGDPLCMDAGTAVPVSPTAVLMKKCSTVNPPLVQQVFAYRNDLTIQLVSSVTTSTPNGLCLTPPAVGSSAVSLSTCQALGATPPYTQQWSYNQYGELQTSVSRSTIDGVLGTQCINLASQVAGLQLTVAPCDNTAADPVNPAADPVQSWTISPGVGAGAAALPQWMNYSEFDRCIYIPPTTAASDHLWSYPCKQDPWAGAVPARQSFSGPPGASGPITSANGSCLTTPTPGGWVTAVSCAVGSLQTWTVNAVIATSPYSTRYTITNGNGLCLGLGTPAAGDKWSAIQTEPCTGAADQKWNVPANAISFTLQNVEK